MVKAALFHKISLPVFEELHQEGALFRPISVELADELDLSLPKHTTLIPEE